MRLLSRVLLIAMICGSAALAQTAPAADSSARAQELLKAARAAIGDEGKIAGVKSLSLAGSSRRVMGERETQTEVEFEALLPDKMRKSTVATPFPGAEFRNVETINGDQYWSETVMPQGMGMGGGRGPGGPGGGPGGGDGGGRNAGGGGPQRMGGGMPGMMGLGDEAARQAATRTEFLRIFLSFLASPPPGVQVEYSVAGEAKAPDGIADVVEIKGPGDAKTRLFIDRVSHRVLMLSYKGKDVAAAFRRGPGGGGPGGGGPGAGGPRQGGGQGQGAPAGGPAGQAGQGGAGQGAGQGGAGTPQPQLTPEEREARRAAQQQRMQEAIAKAPDVDFFWRFADYKSEGGLNLPHVITKSMGDRIEEEWVISKVKVNPNIKADKFEKKDKK